MMSDYLYWIDVELGRRVIPNRTWVRNVLDLVAGKRQWIAASSSAEVDTWDASSSACETWRALFARYPSSRDSILLMHARMQDVDVILSALREAVDDCGGALPYARFLYSGHDTPIRHFEEDYLSGGVPKFKVRANEFEWKGQQKLPAEDVAVRFERIIDGYVTSSMAPQTRWHDALCYSREQVHDAALEVIPWLLLECGKEPIDTWASARRRVRNTYLAQVLDALLRVKPVVMERPRWPARWGTIAGAVRELRQADAVDPKMVFTRLLRPLPGADTEERSALYGLISDALRELETDEPPHGS